MAAVGQALHKSSLERSQQPHEVGTKHTLFTTSPTLHMGEIEAQGSQAICPESHSLETAGPEREVASVRAQSRLSITVPVTTLLRRLLQGPREGNGHLAMATKGAPALRHLS